ncbi:hypothetical protein [Clostridium botulinum]|uniref:hypothetical protein n=1 Tax=Clostridium botulinum TaxID=1491 RepID=UPI00069AF810|nr:hypothetical protein [Clostridium botulinum]KOA94036.1 hypothetical protein ADU76_04295 [Clostridium botulinum]KOC32895.1 hypothetical protein ADU81_10790 [Clostridium botulinum]MCD3202305.1 hypothetical protein [Clostridium botulinum C/D]MCD3223678.1 hypothetical protein [Clostridium botulinum C/D]MCD3230400.1 hypothetical protein [Clostridium botulinum C/D]
MKIQRWVSSNKKVYKLKKVHINQIIRYIEKREGIDMAVLSTPMECMPIIKAEKFDEFMKEADKTLVTEEEKMNIREIMRNVVRRKRQRH